MSRTHTDPVVLLRINEAGERIGRKRTTVFELIKKGELEAVQLGPRTVRIPSDSVDAYIERARRRARSKRRGTDATPPPDG